MEKIEGSIMYGMIHQAARAYAIEQLGEPFWDGFTQQHDLTEAAFVLGQSYSDEMTFGMIGGLAAATETPPAQLLRQFGRYWIKFASKGAYSNMMLLGGGTLPAFLSNLNRMHSGLAAAMPGSKMPLFYLVEDTPLALRLRYVSQRAGLEPFVVGLLEGLCEMFALAADVSSGADDDAVTFEICYRLSVVV